jgi:Tol biopolymer transport system component
MSSRGAGTWLLAAALLGCEEGTVNNGEVRLATTVLVSVDSLGNAANGASRAPSISADGRRVVFESVATNLDPADPYNDWDVYVRDTRTGTTRLVSRASNGAAGGRSSFSGSISADGRRVAFLSGDGTLGGPDGWDHVYVRDLETGETLLVSRASGASGAAAVWVDPADGRNKVVNWSPSISGDGLKIAFESNATNLDPEDTTDDYDVYVRDLSDPANPRTVWVSRDAPGPIMESPCRRPRITADGRYVYFEYTYTYLDGAAGTSLKTHAIARRDLTAGTTQAVLTVPRLDTPGLPLGDPADHTHGPSVSADGRFVAFHSQNNDFAPFVNYGSQNLILWDQEATPPGTSAVSVSLFGTHANGPSMNPSVSADGRYVAFESNASNLIAQDLNRFADVFVRDRVLGITARASVRTYGAEAFGASSAPALSGDGRFVAFVSDAPDLVDGDANGIADVFVRGPLR